MRRYCAFCRTKEHHVRYDFSSSQEFTVKVYPSSPRSEEDFSDDENDYDEDEDYEEEYDELVDYVVEGRSDVSLFNQGERGHQAE